MTQPALRVWYDDDGVGHSISTHQKRPRAANNAVHDYACSKNVSSDGCTTKADVDYRSQMLKSITRGYEDERLKLRPNWVL